MSRPGPVFQHLVFAWAILMAGLLPVAPVPAQTQTQKLAITAVAEKRIARLPPGLLFWRIDSFATLARAQAAAGPTALAAEVAGKSWLFTLGPAGGVSPGATRVAEIGPLPTFTASEYLLRINHALGRPGARTPVHSHPGAETFFVLGGQLTQQTPGGVNTVSAGQSMLGHAPDTPMQVSNRGTGDLDALVMFVTDATRRFSSPATMP